MNFDTTNSGNTDLSFTGLGFVEEQSDKLSEILTGHSVALSPDLRTKELRLRPLLIDAFNNLRESRLTLGGLLRDLRTIYKGKRIWTLLAEDLGKEIGRDKRTIFRMIEEYERNSGLRAPKPKTAGASDSDQFDQADNFIGERLLEVRYHVRAAVSGYPTSRRLRILTQAIQAEAFEWGLTGSHLMEIHPQPSFVTISEDDVVPDAPTCGSELADWGSNRGSGLTLVVN